jgi:hypothetical protein
MQRRAQLGLQLKGRLQALPANIDKGGRVMIMRNNLAYYNTAKFYGTGPWAKNYKSFIPMSFINVCKKL